MRRLKKQRKFMTPQHNINLDKERWLVSYADFITLLFAFFVVMYAISSINLDKYKVVADTFKRAMPTQSSTTKSAAQLPQTKEQTIQLTANRYSKSLETAVPNFLDGEVVFRNTDEWLEIGIRSQILFKNNSTELSAEAITFLERLGKSLAELPFPILVEGYSDNQPINSRLYSSNWELAGARAAAVTKILVTNGVDPTSIASVSFGQYQPIRNNTTLAGRQENRRVTILVLWNPDLQNVLLPRFRNPNIEAALFEERQAAAAARLEAVRIQTEKEFSAPVNDSVSNTNVKEQQKNNTPVLRESRIPGGGIRIGRELE